MPSCTSLIRLLRRRLVLGLIFALSLMYCIFSLLQNEKAGILLRPDYIDIRLLLHSVVITFTAEDFTIFFTEWATESGQ